MQARDEFTTFASCPRTNTFLDVALAAALFGTIVRIRPTNTESSDTHASHTYQVKFAHSNSAFVAKEENINGVYFTREGSKNIRKKQAILQEKKAKTPDLDQWDVILLVGSELGSKDPVQQIMDQPALPFG